jgi:hypothetical protein
MKPIGCYASRSGGVFLELTLIAVLAHAQSIHPANLTGTDPVAAGPAPSTLPGKAILYVYRFRRYDGAALRPYVYVDQKEMARMENGQFFAVILDPGKHSVRFRDKASRVDLDMKAGADYYIRVDLRTGFWKGHSRLNLVFPEQGAYEVKQTGPCIRRR